MVVRRHDTRSAAGQDPTLPGAAPSNKRMTLPVNDIRLAVRGLLRSPLFAIVAILSLGLGIGANTAIFTLIDQILLRKLPVVNPEELVMLYQEEAGRGRPPWCRRGGARWVRRRRGRRKRAGRRRTASRTGRSGHREAGVGPQRSSTRRREALADPVRRCRP